MILRIRTPRDKDKVKAYVDDLKTDKKKYIVEVKVEREQRYDKARSYNRNAERDKGNAPLFYAMGMGYTQRW